MAETVIEWVRGSAGDLGYTFNPWIGCEHVSRACDHCYAEFDAPARVRRAKGHETWGPHAKRSRTSEANWRLPLRWSRRAASKAIRQRVFCASQADWLDNKVPIEWLVDLLDLIRRTEHLDWLLLSKRAGNWARRIEEARLRSVDQGRAELAEWLANWQADEPPKNVWLGATIADQEEADRDIVKLLRCPAAVRFVSMEPLLGAVDLRGYCPSSAILGGGGARLIDLLDWVIVGGESGRYARPCHPDWVRSLRDQCAEAHVPFFFKQWGEWHTAAYRVTDGVAIFRQFTDYQHWVAKAPSWVRGGICLDKYGRELRIGADFMRARDECSFPVTVMHRVGKAAAGRLLDGVLHEASPSVAKEAC
ncbi:phage Gp37/Gp68 family protein [Rubrivivax gelatinosus]|uniref:phage Gp37/Gp68 family protein n=1 Tax=Rubrivivax gelatinosus TaxID=28068 RepID=UPI0002D523C2|nr:phage Gp37/Gp68 family protein [Rubrivivax gelatinosus]MBG6083084.1 protein gp37 [Rubrivivax gelatinosus]